MRRSSKKGISLVLSLCMLLSILIMPVPVRAEGEGAIVTMGPNPKYAVGQEVGVQVDDADLGTDTVDVTVTSNINPEGVIISLSKDSSNPGKYNGTIVISSDINDPGQPNRIQAENGHTITFSYNDGGEVRSTSIDVANRVEKPSASIDPSQPVTEETAVQLICNTSGASIYYTTDGSEPRRTDEDGTNTSMLYDDDHMPIIDANEHLVIKAFAIAEGMADSEVAGFEYNPPAESILAGRVLNPDPDAPGGRLEIFQQQNGNYIFIKSVNINEASSSFTIAGEEYGDGSYRLRVNPSMESMYSFSDWFYYKVSDADLYYTNDELITDEIGLTLSPVQVKGLLKNATGDTLGLVDCGLRIKSEEGYGADFEWYRNESSYKLSGLADGTYSIWLEPIGESVYALSGADTFTITDGNSNKESIDLQLTTPQFTGNVYKPDGETPSEGGCVSIYNGAGYNLRFVAVQPNGTFSIGGLEPGDYTISAYPPGVAGYENIDVSARIPIKITALDQQVETVDLQLRNIAPRLKYADCYIKGSNELTARIMHADKIQQGEPDRDAIRAEIMLGDEVKAELNQYWIKDFDNQSGDATLVMNGFESLNLDFGKYTLKLYLNGNLLDVEESSDLWVVSGLETYPQVVAPGDYSAASLKLDVNKINDNRQYPWESGDDLTVKITVGKHWDIQKTVPASINVVDNTLTIDLPDDMPGLALEENGWHDIAVYRDGTELLAVGRFDIGVSEIKNISAAEASDHLVIAGEYMSKYMNEPYIEIYKGGKKIITSYEWFNYWGNLDFSIRGTLKADEEYQLKLFAKIDGVSKQIDLPDGGIFKPVPRLNVDGVPTIKGIEGQTVTIKESSYTGFGWDVTDNISAVVSGPGAGDYIATTGNGITVQSDDKVVFTIKYNQQRPSQSQWHDGMYSIKLYDAVTGVTYGVTNFFVDNAQSEVLNVTVNGSDGNASGNGIIKISKVNDNWSDTTMVYPDGKFYYPVSMMKGEGTYEIYAEAVKDSNDLAGKAKFTLGDDGHIVVGEVTTPYVQITLAKVQVKGFVKEDQENTTAGRVYLHNKDKEMDWLRYETDINYDGSYKLAAIEPGVYDIVAFGDGGSVYLCSDNAEITIASGSVVNQDLVLKLPQVTGTAKNVDGTSDLRGGRYEVKIRNLNPGREWQDGCAWRGDDGRYLLGGLEPGNYEVYIQPNPDTELPYSKSCNEFFTISEDGTANPSAIDLQLTQPKVVGTLYKDEARNETFSNAIVDIFQGDWKDLRYLACAPVLEDGRFFIGGIDNGTYYIRAALTDREHDTGLSQSITTKIIVGQDLTVALNLRDTTPRIKYIEDYNINSNELRVRVINVKDMDLTKLKIEITDLGHYTFSGSREITGDKKVWLDDGSWDYNKDEGSIVINMDSITLNPGKYDLKLTYVDSENPLVLENDTPEVNDFNGFMAFYDLQVYPFAVLPEDSNGKILELGLDIDPESYPWNVDVADLIRVELQKPDGTLINLEEFTVDVNNILKVKLPAELEEGKYQLSVQDYELPLAKGWLTVGYPIIYGADDTNDANDCISISGENLIIYTEGENVLNVYDASDKLVVTTKDVSFEWGRLVFRMKNRRLAPGSYNLEWTYKGNTEEMPLKVVNWLRTTPGYFIAGTGSTNGKEMQLEIMEGSTPLWDIEDDLKVTLAHEGYDGTPSVVLDPDEVIYGRITVTLNRDIMNSGSIIVNVIRNTDTGEEFIATSRFDVVDKVQIKGSIKDASEKGVPYAHVQVDKVDGGWGTGFEADANGDYAIYGLEPGNYKITVFPPKGTALLGAEETDIAVDDTTQTHNFVLEGGLMISGTVKLPDSDIAESDIHLWINAWSDNDTEDDKDDDVGIGNEVIIPQGSSSAEYSIIVPDTDAKYRLRLMSFDGGDYIYCPTYYSSKGSTYRIAEADEITTSDIDLTGKDITLIRGSEIKGTISLPGDIKAMDDFEIELIIEKESESKERYQNIDVGYIVEFKQETRSADYRIIVPEEKGYVVRYNQMSEMKLADWAFYKSPTESTVYYDKAASVNAQSDVSGLDITMLGAKYISGTVTLPEGAPEGGTDMWVLASLNRLTENWDDDISFAYNLKIPAGGTSGNYTIKVPDIADKYIVEFWGGVQVGCVDNVIYSASGPVYTVAEAAKLDVAGGDVSGINFTIPRGKKITGTVTLPTGAPAGGMKIGVEAFIEGNGDFTNRTSVFTDVIIPGGENSGDYTLIVPDEDGYRVRYNADKYPNFMREGYYTKKGTTFQFDKADPLDMMTGGDKSDIDLSLTEAKYIRGTVTLPQDPLANSAGVMLYLNAMDDMGTSDWKDDERFHGEVLIEAKKNSGNYSIQVPDYTASYYVELNEGGRVGCVNTIYYKYTGVGSFNLEGATKVSVVQAGPDIDGININLVLGKTITGTVKLPADADIPANGLGMTIEAYAENDTDNYKDDISSSTKAWISNESLEGIYTLVVPAVSGYVVKYISDENDNFMPQGFYTDDGTVLDSKDAQTFDLSGIKPSLTGIDLTVTASKTITGTVTLPVAAQQYGTMWILAVDDKGTDDRDDDIGYGALVEMKANSDSAAFKLKVPDTNTSYFIEIWGAGQFGCIDNLFYKGNAQGAAYSPASAKKIDGQNGTFDNIVFAMEPGKKISGIVKLPEGMTAPAGGYGFKVFVMKDNDIQKVSDDVVYSTEFIIDEGYSSYNYEMNIPVLDGYRLVVFSDSDLLEKRLYYSKEGMTVDVLKADNIDAISQEPLNFDLQLAATSQFLLNAAQVNSEGSAVMLRFNKPLDGTVGLGTQAILDSFTVMVEDSVGVTKYELNSVGYTEDSMGLILNLKDYRIFKDYKSIKVSYTGTAIKAYDGKTLDAFTDKSAENKSSKQIVISGAANGALYNRTIAITASSGGDTITIGDGSRTGSELKFETSGTFTVTVSSNTRKNPLSLSFEIDKVKPTVTIDVPATTENSHAGVIPTVTFGGDEKEYRVITLNGSVYKDTIIKEAGVYTITATTKDKAGNTGTATAAFEIKWDTKAPVITVVGITNGGIYKSVTPVISVGGTGSNSANYTYTAKLKKPDGTFATYSKGVSIQANDTIADGAYRLEILAVNPSYTDITSTEVIEFTIDNTSPAVAISNVTRVMNGTQSSLFNVPVTPVITFTDNVAPQQVLAANAEITLRNGATQVAYKLGGTISADGSYTLTVKTSDANGNESTTATATFTIDRTKPVITLSGAVNGNTYKDEDVTVTAAASEGTLTVKQSGQTIVWTGDSKVFAGEAGKVVTYDLEFTAVDNAGNQAVQTLKFTIDRLPVNISISGVNEGMVTNSDPYISFTVFEGEVEKQGARAKIDGTAFAGGRYSVAGNHTLTVEYVSGENTYTKTVTFIIDKTAPQITAGEVKKNGNIIAQQVPVYAKTGDIGTITADIADVNGVGDVWFSIGSPDFKVPMKKAVGADNTYEGSYTIEGSNYDNLTLTVFAKDKAGNVSSLAYTQKFNIDNSKPVVNVTTNPAKADGSNGIYKATDMKVTLNAAPTDTISYNFNGSSGTAAGTKELTPIQGSNVLLYSAVDLAGNQSDTKVLVFEYDSVKPENLTVNAVNALVNSPVITITGSVTSEVGKTGSRVLLKKADEIVAQAVVISAGGAFTMDGVRLAEGDNTFALTAIDRAGNESTATTVTVRLDSTAPIVKVEKSTSNELIYNITVNEAVSTVSAKFNGVAVPDGMIVNTGALTYTIEVSGMLDGSNTLNVTAVDMAGNTGAGSFTSTYIPADTQQNDVPLNDNASMDIPVGAFTGTGNVQMLVRTVDVQGADNYKPLGAPISFEFKKGETSVEPEKPLVIRNFIGTGLTGVMLMHIDDQNVVGTPIIAIMTNSTAFDEGSMDTFEHGKAYYLSDTGYLIFKTQKFSAYQVAQDNTAPVITVTTQNFKISKYDSGIGYKLEGELADDDAAVKVTEVKVDGAAIDLSGVPAENKDKTFSIPLNLADGTHEVILKAADTVGNTSSVTRTYHVDITPPTLTNVAPATDETNRNTVELTFTTSESADVRVNGAIMGNFTGTNTISVMLISEGENPFTINAVDAMNNMSNEVKVTVTRDSAAPVITVTGVSNGDIVGGPVNISVGITDINIDTKSITLDGVSETSLIPGYNVPGTHTLVVNAADTYGNTSTVTLSFTIDNSAPIINITGADDGSVYGEAKTLQISASNADSLKVTKAVNGGTAQDVVNTAPLTAGIVLDPGVNTHNTYTIRATAQKTVSGQIRNAVKTIVVAIDKKKPVIANTTTAQTEAASIDVTGSIDEASDLYLNNVLVTEDSPAGSFRFTGKALVLGNNTFTVKAVDAVGNASELTITVKRVEPQQEPGGNPGNPNPDGGVFIPFIPGLEEEVVILDPIGHKNSGLLPEVKDPVTGKVIASAENKEIGTSGGTVTSQDGAFKLVIPANTVNDQKNTFRIVIFELDPESPLSVDEQISSGSIKLASKVVDFSTDAEVMQKPVKATFKYDSKAVTDPSNLRVFYWNVRTNAWVPVAMADTVIDAKNGTAVATLNHFTRYAVMEVKSTLKYADVQSQWHSTYVERASLMGVINGFVTKGVREFKPNSPLSRAEFVTMLARVLKLDAKSKDVSVFKDASGIADWSKGYIKAAYDKGIIRPYEDGTFMPAQNITRSEMAEMLVKAMGLKPEGNASAFEDQKDIPASIRPYVTTASELNIIVGKGDGKFYPEDSLTRAEASKVIVEMIEVLGKL